jgi:hypothetical protein
VLLHRGEADRIAAGQRRDREIAAAGTGEDVAAGGVGERFEEKVRAARLELI